VQTPVRVVDARRALRCFDLYTGDYRKPRRAGRELRSCAAQVGGGSSRDRQITYDTTVCLSVSLSLIFPYHRPRASSGCEQAVDGEMPEATTHSWQQSIRRRATIGDVCSAHSLQQAAPKGLSEQLAPLEGVLHKQHRSSKVLAWGKRYFRVDDLREALCYYRTEAQYERQDPVLRLPLRNLAAVRRLQQPPLEFLFELRLFSPVAVAGWAGRSCRNTGQQRPAVVVDDDDDNEYEYEVSDKQAPRSFIVRADTEAEAEAWVCGLQARIARRWHRPASARAPTPPLDPNIEEVCRALGAALSLDDHRCGGDARPLSPPAAPPPVPPATPRDPARDRDLGQDRDADFVPALDLRRRASAEARRAPPESSEAARTLSLSH
jgi:hypothetical protein